MRNKKRVVFAFSGIGAQWKTMGAELFEKEKVFREAILECDRFFSRCAGWSIVEELTRDKIHSRVEESLIAHPCNFALQVALARLLCCWGIVPAAVIGHSSGEVAAACTAGILDTEDAVKVVRQHCRLMEKVMGKGTMLHISLPLAELHGIVEKYEGKIAVASVNSYKATVLSGETQLLHQVYESFKKKNIFCRLLRVDIPFHSPAVEPHLEEFRQAIGNIKVNPPTVPIYSTLHGGVAEPGDYGASYWARHIREMILFAPAVDAMIKDGYRLFIEIGPHAVLSAVIQECFQENQTDDYLVVGTLKRDEKEKDQLMTAVARLHAGGCPVDWDKLQLEDRQYARSVLDSLENEKKECSAIKQNPLTGIAPGKRKDFLVHLVHDSIVNISRQTIVPPADTQTGFFDMGLNSITAIQLKSELEKKLQVSLPGTVVFDYPGTEALVEYLEARLSAAPGAAAGAGDESKGTRSKPRPLPVNEPIAIVGMGCRFPGGSDNPDLFWKLLETGNDAIREIPPGRWEVDDYYHPDPGVPGKTVSRWGGMLADSYIKGFDAHFFKVPPKEANALDPQQRLLLEVCWEALEHAGIAPASLRNQQVGVYLGICTDDYKGSHLYSHSLERIDAYSATGSMYSSAGGRISYFLGLQGPNISVDTACSSSLVALHLACQALRGGECDLALAAGVNALLSPNLFVYFTKLGAISPEGRCKTFDASANGYVRGEGCGAVVLKRLSAAQKHGDTILAVIRGSALNQDGASTSFIAPNGLTQQRVICQALDCAGFSAADVDYIEAHGTGTPVGDPIELEALHAVYGAAHTREHPVRVGSVKTNIGHLEGAAGIASLIKVILIFQKETIPPHLNFSQPNPLFDWDKTAIKVNTRLTPWKRGEKPRRSGISSFGFSGSNAHVIVEEAPLPGTAHPAAGGSEADRTYILTLSAKSDPALQELALRYWEYVSQPALASNPVPELLANICFTANTGRSHFSKRLALTGKTPGEIKAKLSAYLDKPRQENQGIENRGIENRETGNKKIAFLYTGQGSQYAGMGQRLYETQPVFRQALHQCDQLFEQYLHGSIIELLYPGGAASGTNERIIRQTNYSQPLIFAVEHALTVLWKSWGITPEAVLGHSIGEFAAAVAAGVFNLEDAVKLVAERGRLMHSVQGKGVMAAVLADEKTVRAALKNHENKAALASINTPDSLVISGEEQVVLAITRELNQKGIKTRMLDVSHAFHSPLMTPILEPFKKIAGKVNYSEPTVTFISGMNGKLAGKELAAARYWVRHIVEPVCFYEAFRTLADQGYEIFLEIGATSTLSSLAAQCVSTPGCAFLPSLRKDKEDWEQLLESLAQLYVRQVDIDWQGFEQPYKRKKIPLPTYPFQRKTYWINPVSVEKRNNRAIPADMETGDYDPFIGQRIVSPAMEKMEIFQTVFSLESGGAFSFLKEHIIYDTVISPAAAHLSMILSAVQRSPGKTASVREVNFIEPLVAGENQSKKIQLIIEHETGDQSAVRIVSQDIPAADGQWHTHCTGKILAQTSRGPGIVDFEAVKTRTLEKLEPRGMYEKMAELGYRLGPSFQCIEEIYRGNHEALCRLKKKAGDSDRNRYVIHPGLMDSILQTILSTSTGYIPLMSETGKIFIPFHVGSMTRYPALFTDTLRCHTRGEYADGIISGDISVYNDSQEICLEIKNFTVKQTDKESLLKYAGAAVRHDELLYSLTWEEKPGEQSKEILPGTYLIFSDSSPLGKYLQRLLTARGVPCVIARKGDRYRRQGNVFTICPQTRTDWERFLKEADWEDLFQLRVLYLWGLEAAAPGDSMPQDIDKQQEEICGSLLYIIKILGRYFKQATLWVVTRYAQLKEPQSQLSLFQSTLAGMGKVIALEHPGIWGGMIDIDDAAEEQAAETILKAITAASAENLVVFRKGKRYVSRLENKPRAFLDRDRGMKPLVDPAGTYLVTGGTGGLGLVIARWLKEKGARNIVLNCRKDPSPRVLEFLEKLNREGGGTIGINGTNGTIVRVMKGDIARAAEVEGLINRINDTMPRLRGIIHAAGTLSDRMISEQNWETFAEVLKPKVNGAWNLHLYTRHLLLDFFVLFSSAASLLGNPGQSSYAAANAFLDALAAYRKALGLTGLSINWGPWGNTGMAVSRDSIKKNLHKQGFRELNPRDAVFLMEKFLQSSYPDAQFGIIACNWNRYADYISQSRGSVPLYLEKLVSRRQQPSAGAGILEEIKTAPAEQGKALLTGLVQESAAVVLGADGSQPFNLQVSLLEQGFDSLMAVELRNVLAKKLDLSLPATLLFNYPSITEIVTHVQHALTADVMGTPAAEPSPGKKSGNDAQFANLDNLSSRELEELINNELDSGI